MSDKNYRVPRSLSLLFGLTVAFLWLALFARIADISKASGEVSSSNPWIWLVFGGSIASGFIAAIISRRS
jgi:hypothetical protein